MTFFGPREQIVSKAVVESRQLANLSWRQPFQKPTECRLIRKPFQPHHFQKGSVVLQNLGLVDPPQSHDDRAHQGEDQLGGMITFVPTLDPNVLLKPFLQPQLAVKTLN